MILDKRFYRTTLYNQFILLSAYGQEGHYLIQIQGDSVYCVQIWSGVREHRKNHNYFGEEGQKRNTHGKQIYKDSIISTPNEI